MSELLRTRDFLGNYRNRRKQYDTVSRHAHLTPHRHHLAGGRQCRSPYASRRAVSHHRHAVDDCGPAAHQLRVANFKGTRLTFVRIIQGPIQGPVSTCETRSS